MQQLPVPTVQSDALTANLQQIAQLVVMDIISLLMLVLHVKSIAKFVPGLHNVPIVLKAIL